MYNCIFLAIQYIEFVAACYELFESMFLVFSAVLHTGTVYDALHAIWENKDRFDLVITNAQKLESEGIAIIRNIKERLKLNVLCKWKLLIICFTMPCVFCSDLDQHQLVVACSDT